VREKVCVHVWQATLSAESRSCLHPAEKFCLHLAEKMPPPTAKVERGGRGGCEPGGGKGGGGAAEGEEGCCCANAIAIAHVRAHRARENSSRLGRVALTGGPVCEGEERACGGDAGTRALSLSHTRAHVGRRHSVPVPGPRPRLPSPWRPGSGAAGQCRDLKHSESTHTGTVWPRPRARGAGRHAVKQSSCDSDRLLKIHLRLLA
jgi:hypothetical protein